MIELQLSDDFYTKSSTRNLTGEALERAIGYLVLWGHTWDSTNIRDDRDGDLIAVYTKGERRFVMGAVWHKEERKYTFHS